MKKILCSVILAILLVMVLVVPLFAAWEYKFPINVQDSGCTLTNGTGTATGSPISLTNGLNTIAITGGGTFVVVITNGTTGTVTSGTSTVRSSPFYLWEGSNTINVTGVGNIIVSLVIPSGRTYYPVDLKGSSGGMSGLSFINNNKINDDGLDTNTQISSSSIKYTIANDRVLAVMPSFPAKSSQTVDFYTGYTPVQTSLPVVVGDRGYLTLADNGAAPLELGNDFEVEIDGVIKTTPKNFEVTNQLNKLGAFNIGITDVNTLTGAIEALTSPTGFVDGGGTWTNEANAYDGNTATFADEIGIAASSWGNFLELTHAALYSRSIRVYASGSTADILQIDVDIYYGAAWHDLYQGEFTQSTWYEFPYVGIQSVTSSRFRFYNNDGANPRDAYLNEVYFVEESAYVSRSITEGEYDIKTKADTNVLQMDIDYDNLLFNSSMEVNDPPLSWTLVGAGATVARSIVQIKCDSYSAALTRNGVDCYISQSYGGFATLAGHSVSVGCWVYATAPNRANLTLWDGVAGAGEFHPGDSTWRWLSITGFPVDIAASELTLRLRIVLGDTTVYYDGAVMVAGTTVTQSTSNQVYASSLSGASVPDNGNDYIFNQGNGLPAMNSYKHTVAGTEVIEYQSDIMIGTENYSTGTATFTNGSATVEGQTTLWDDSLIGGLIKPDADSAYYVIAGVTDADTLTIDRAYIPATSALAAYHIYGDRIQDQDNYLYYGAITWGTNTSVNLIYDEMESYGSTSAVPSSTGGFAPNQFTMPSTWFGTGSGVANLPFYDSFYQVSLQTGQPVVVIYFLGIIGLAFAIFLAMVLTTRSALLGALGFNIVLFVGSSMTVIPLWIPFVCMIVMIGIMYLYRQVSY